MQPLGHTERRSDEQVLLLNHERFMVPEALFFPSDLGIMQAGVHEAVWRAVQAAPAGPNGALGDALAHVRTPHTSSSWARASRGRGDGEVGTTAQHCGNAWSATFGSLGALPQCRGSRHGCTLLAVAGTALLLAADARPIERPSIAHAGVAPARSSWSREAELRRLAPEAWTVRVTVASTYVHSPGTLCVCVCPTCRVDPYG